MKSLLQSIWRREAFSPTILVGIWINPVFIVRRGLVKGVKSIANQLNGGRILDVGCGSKPYEFMFVMDEYIGIDIEVSGHDHSGSKIDKFYDGKKIPFPDKSFDHVFSSEVFEHVFNIEELLSEINRVLKDGGKLGFTCPFVWYEHEQPYDYARYTTFAIDHLLTKHGFKLIRIEKSTGHIETIFQMLSSYVFQHILPNNNMMKIILTPIFVAPINILAVILGAILPRSGTFYHNNIVVAEKISKTSV